MPNTIVNQPTAASLQLTDYLLAWQGAQSPSTRKLPVSGLAGYYLALTGGTLSAGLTITTGGITVSAGGATITGNATITGSLTVTGAISLTSSLTMNNNQVLYAKDSGAVSRGLLWLNASDYVNTTVAGGGVTEWRILDQTAVTRLFAVGNTGNMYAAGTSTLTGAVTASSTLAVAGATTLSSTLAVTGAVTMPNNTALKMKDSGGTARDILYVSAADLTNLVNAGGSNFQILNQAKDTALFVMSNTGVITLPGSIGINGTSAGSVAGAGQLLTSGAGTGASGPIAYSISCAGSITGTAIYATSDKRAKSEIEAITPEDGLDYVMAGRPVKFLMYGCRGAGFLAQEDAITVRAGSINILEDSRPEFAEADGVAPAGHRLVKSYEHDIAYLTAAVRWLVMRVSELEAAA